MFWGYNIMFLRYITGLSMKKAAQGAAEVVQVLC